MRRVEYTYQLYAPGATVTEPPKPITADGEYPSNIYDASDWIGDPSDYWEGWSDTAPLDDSTFVGKVNIRRLNAHFLIPNTSIGWTEQFKSTGDIYAVTPNGLNNKGQRYGSYYLHPINYFSQEYTVNHFEENYLKDSSGNDVSVHYVIKKGTGKYLLDDYHSDKEETFYFNSPVRQLQMTTVNASLNFDSSYGTAEIPYEPYIRVDHTYYSFPETKEHLVSEFQGINNSSTLGVPMDSSFKCTVNSPSGKIISYVKISAKDTSARDYVFLETSANLDVSYYDLSVGEKYVTDLGATMENDASNLTTVSVEKTIGIDCSLLDTLSVKAEMINTNIIEKYYWYGNPSNEHRATVYYYIQEAGTVDIFRYSYNKQYGLSIKSPYSSVYTLQQFTSNVDYAVVVDWEETEFNGFTFNLPLTLEHDGTTYPVKRICLRSNSNAGRIYLTDQNCTNLPDSIIISGRVFASHLGAFSPSISPSLTGLGLSGNYNIIIDDFVPVLPSNANERNGSSLYAFINFDNLMSNNLINIGVPNRWQGYGSNMYEVASGVAEIWENTFLFHNIKGVNTTLTLPSSVSKLSKYFIVSENFQWSYTLDRYGHFDSHTYDVLIDSEYASDPQYVEQQITDYFYTLQLRINSTTPPTLVSETIYGETLSTTLNYGIKKLKVPSGSLSLYQNSAWNQQTCQVKWQAVENGERIGQVYTKTMPYILSIEEV